METRVSCEFTWNHVVYIYVKNKNTEFSDTTFFRKNEDPDSLEYNANEFVDAANIAFDCLFKITKDVNVLKSFGVETRLVDVSRGPAVTRYEL